MRAWEWGYDNVRIDYSIFNKNTGTDFSFQAFTPQATIPFSLLTFHDQRNLTASKLPGFKANIITASHMVHCIYYISPQWFPMHSMSSPTSTLGENKELVRDPQSPSSTSSSTSSFSAVTPGSAPPTVTTASSTCREPGNVNREQVCYMHVCTVVCFYLSNSLISRPNLSCIPCSLVQ